MKMTVASAAFCMMSAALAAKATAQSASAFNFGGISPSHAAFTLMPAGPEDRIYLNETMLKKEPKRSRLATLPAALGRPASQVRHLIAAAEAGAQGYDAVQHGAETMPAKRPTDMTIDEIYQWIKATPGQPHAIGRYQFIPATLKSLVVEAGVDTSAVFSEGVQDLLADILLEDAGFTAFMDGKMSRHRFMENLARIWAGFPTSTGRSYYHGYAGNRAVITWNEFNSHMKNIFEKESRHASRR